MRKTKKNEEDMTWIYYSQQLPEYFKKYGSRGIRERNAKYLSFIKKTKHPEILQRCRELLVENNIPLAKAMSERWGENNEWDNQKIKEAYSICLTNMTEFIMGHDLTGLNQKQFSNEIGMRMRGAISWWAIKENEREERMVILDEEDLQIIEKVRPLNWLEKRY